MPIFFLCFPNGQFALKMSCLDSKPRAIAPWSPRLVYYRSFLTLQSGGRSQVDCTIIQIELKTSKQIFRCRPGCIEQGILLCQLGWQRKTWNEMDTNGGFLWRQSFHFFLIGEMLTWHVMLWVFHVVFEASNLKISLQHQGSRNLKSDGGTPETTMSWSPFPLNQRSACCFIKIWTAILNINAYKNMNN